MLRFCHTGGAVFVRTLAHTQPASLQLKPVTAIVLVQTVIARVAQDGGHGGGWGTSSSIAPPGPQVKPPVVRVTAHRGTGNRPSACAGKVGIFSGRSGGGVFAQFGRFYELFYSKISSSSSTEI